MAAAEKATLKPGDVVGGRYTLVEPIGVGGSATVYRAQQAGMSREVALKVMHAEHPDSDTEKARFAREAELVMKLTHPHVVPLLDYGHTISGVPYLVFTLLEGQSLDRVIKTEGALSWERAGRIAVMALKALEKAHSLGVVHRDIKPANIFLSSGVLGEMAQVLDFGLAKMVKDSDTKVTQAGALVGTPRYMAPEQVRGEIITHAADIYAFGLVLAEMLHGSPLVTGDKELDIYVAQGSDRPIVVPDGVLATPFGNIVQRAVSKPVEVRYQLASQMLADVEAVVSDLGGNQDVEADLDATRMLDPSKLAVPTNPHAEKMRRVLNAAANKKAAAEKAVRRPPTNTSTMVSATPVPPKGNVSEVATMTVPAAPAPPVAGVRRSPRGTLPIDAGNVIPTRPGPGPTLPSADRRVAPALEPEEIPYDPDDEEEEDEPTMLAVPSLELMGIKPRVEPEDEDGPTLEDNAPTLVANDALRAAVATAEARAPAHAAPPAPYVEPPTSATEPAVDLPALIQQRAAPPAIPIADPPASRSYSMTVVALTVVLLLIAAGVVVLLIMLGYVVV